MVPDSNILPIDTYRFVIVSFPSLYATINFEFEILAKLRGCPYVRGPFRMLVIDIESFAISTYANHRDGVDDASL